MPRCNVEYNHKWACFSTIVDGFITSFMNKLDYETWRMEEYGRANYKPLKYCNKMTMQEAVSTASLNHSKDDIVNNLVESGIPQEEAESLWAQYQEEPEEAEPETENNLAFT